MILLEENNIIYQTLNKEYLSETISLNTRHFVKEEYLIRALKFSYEEYEPFVQNYCEYDLHEKLSVIAIDKITNKVIGFSICEDPALPTAIDVKKFFSISEKYEKIIAVLEALHESCKVPTFCPGECYHLFMLGVENNYQGKKIGKTLVHLSGLHAKNKKFKYILVEATSPMTKPICEKDGYTNLGNIPYKDFIHEEKKPFSGITDYDGPYLLIKKLI